MDCRTQSITKLHSKVSDVGRVTIDVHACGPAALGSLAHEQRRETRPAKVEETPLRLALGADALYVIREKLIAELESYERWESVSVSTAQQRRPGHGRVSRMRGARFIVTDKPRQNIIYSGAE